MTINVGNFSSKLPNKLSIANSMPKGVKMRTVKKLYLQLAMFIVPSWGLVGGLKNGKISWEIYARIYQENLSKINLRQVMENLCALVNKDELTLCCWERADDEHCHRKLLYDMLPDDIKGVRE